jgi:hypothetical protein
MGSGKAVVQKIKVDDQLKISPTQWKSEKAIAKRLGHDRSRAGFAGLACAPREYCVDETRATCNNSEGSVDGSFV